jgi:hypothetical protein
MHTTLNVLFVAARAPGSPSHVSCIRVMTWAMAILLQHKAHQMCGCMNPREKQLQRPSFQRPVGAMIRGEMTFGGSGAKKVSPSVTPPSGYI